MAEEEPIPLESADAPKAEEAKPSGERRAEADDEPISLVDAEEGAGSTSVRAFGAAAAERAKRAKLKRPLNVTGQGATRCRIFHSKIADVPLEHMENAINEWLDSEQIEIKHVGHIIGTLEGKRPEPNLFVIVWY